MKWPSMNLLLHSISLAFMMHLLYKLSLSFVLPPCVETRDCVASSLRTKPQLKLDIWTSATSHPIGLDLVHSEVAFNYSEARQMQVLLPIHEEIHRIGTLFLHVILSSERVIKYPGTYYEMIQEPITHYSRIQMTHYKVPETIPFNLLNNEKKSTESMKHLSEPVSHLKNQVTLMMVTDDIKLSAHNLPPELARGIRITKNGMFPPIVYYNFPKNWYRDSVKISPQNEAINVTIGYTPISIGKLRLIVNLGSMLELGALVLFDHNRDEITEILVDTDPYLLGGTIFITAIHFLFQFLTLQFDVAFWRSREIPGFSAQTVLWHAFSKAVVFFYLLHERCALFVLIFAFIRPIAEFWKSMKYLKAKLVTDQGWLPRIRFRKCEPTSDEGEKLKFSTEIIRHSSYLLYPLVVGGAMYSLLYQPQKSWNSWGINSLVSGVYAFGFLFMLRKLFINYEHKSVPYLPWRAMIYKASDTVMDDVFAFVIPMPTAYRIACFRDDAIFLVELYQRCLYPVHKYDKDDVVATDKAPTSHEMHDKKED